MSLPADEGSAASTRLDRWASWTLRHRPLVLSAIGLISIAAAWLAVRAPYQGTLVDAFVDDHRQYEHYQQLCAEFGGNGDDLIFVATDEGDRLFTAEVLTAIRAAATELSELPEIDRVSCLADAPRIPRGRLSASQMAARSTARRRLLAGTLGTTANELEIACYWPTTTERQQTVDLVTLQVDAMADPALLGMLLSSDGRAQGMVARLKSAATVSLPSQKSLRPRIEAILRHHDLGSGGVYVAGMIPVQGWLFGEMDRALYQIMPIGGLVLGFILWCMFRRIGVVIVTALTAFVAILWSVGFAAAVFGELSILVAAAPLLILVITTAETVYLTSAYRQESTTGLSREAALRKVIREVGGACLLTSGTTFIGFLSLVTVGAPTMRHMALTVAMGVAVGLLLTLTLVPIVYSFLSPFASPGQERRSNVLQTFVRKVINGCRLIWHSWPKTIIAVAVLIMAGSSWIALPMQIDPDVPARFPTDHSLPRSVAFFNTRMSGTTYVELFLSAEAGRWTQPDAIRRLAALEDQLQGIAGVRAVHSVVDLWTTTDRAVGFGTSDQLPPTPLAAESSLNLAQSFDRDAVDGLVNPARGRVRMVVQLAPSAYREISALGEQIEQLAVNAMPDDVHIDVLGSYSIIGSVVGRIIRSYFYGIILSAVAICLTLAWGLGSWRVGLWAMFPNLLPMTLLGAMLVLSFDKIDSDMLIIPMTALGIAVDDTIHFLHRYHLCLRKTRDRKLALDQAFDYTGTAILQTTLLLSAGLLPYALSPFLSVWMLGTYMVMTLMFAVVCDLLLTPAMAKLGLFRWKHDATSAELTIAAAD